MTNQETELGKKLPEELKPKQLKLFTSGYWAWTGGNNRLNFSLNILGHQGSWACRSFLSPDLNCSCIEVEEKPHSHIQQQVASRTLTNSLEPIMSRSVGKELCIMKVLSKACFLEPIHSW